MTEASDPFEERLRGFRLVAPPPGLRGRALGATAAVGSPASGPRGLAAAAAFLAAAVLFHLAVQERAGRALQTAARREPPARAAEPLEGLMGRRPQGPGGGPGLALAEAILRHRQWRKEVSGS
ncbi:MAG: hypothetical protein HY722_00940 [Planctomycetes bacterium]|nr:hypothetical protein [Planctomycetota bacterium]